MYLTIHSMLRCFIDTSAYIAAVRGHIGTHPIVITRLVQNQSFVQQLQEVHAVVQASLFSSGPCMLYLICRAGEIRSVAMATVVSTILRRCGYAVREPTHLSSWFWRFRTCAGDCPVCSCPHVDRANAFTQAEEVWRTL